MIALLPIQVLGLCILAFAALSFCALALYEHRENERQAREDSWASIQEMYADEMMDWYERGNR